MRCSVQTPSFGQGTRVTAPSSKADCVSVRQWRRCGSYEPSLHCDFFPRLSHDHVSELLSNEPMCGRTTSVSDTDTQVAGQDTRGSEVTRRVRTPTMNLPTSHTQLYIFIQGTALARVKALIKLCATPVAQQRLGHCVCRSAT